MNLTLQGEPLEFRLLGVTITNDLSWRQHNISEITSKAKRLFIEFSRRVALLAWPGSSSVLSSPTLTTARASGILHTRPKSQG